MARAVVAAVQQQLPHAWCVSPLSPHHVLFMHRPPGASPATTVHRGVWRVVCLAAVNAMDVGRRAAACQQQEARAAAAEAAAAAAAGQPQPAAAGGQRRVSDVWQPAPLSLEQQQRRERVQLRQQALQQQRRQEQQEALEARLEEVKREAVARFWELLHDFVVMRAAPAAWLPALSPGHPLLRVSSGLGGFRCVALAQQPAP